MKINYTKIKDISINIGKKLLNFAKFLAIVLSIAVAIYYGIDFIFKTLLPSLSRAVLSNFIIFSLIIYVVMRQHIHPQAILEQFQTKIENEIKESEVAKEESEAELNAVQKSVKNVKKEIDSILSKSEENAKLVGEKVLDDAQKSTIIIQENTDKAIENSQMILRNELLKRASLASVEVAKRHIINELSWNQGLHDKLINESIDALDNINYGVEL